MLGLGRAIGETIAVTLVIGNAPMIGDSIFQQGYTLAAVIANEFGEAASDQLHRAALIAAGLVLFVLTLVVNAVARCFVDAGRARAARGAQAGGRDGRADRGDASSRRSAPAPARRQGRARGSSALATGVALVPLVLILYYLLKQGLGGVELGLLHDRPDRLVPRRPGRHQERDHRHRR